MKSLRLLTQTAIVLVILSFSKKPDAFEIPVFGKYGVCTYEKNSPEYLELTLNNDYTFHYIDQTNAKKPIDVQGTWKINKYVITFQNYQSDHRIHSKWKFDTWTKCVESRRGMTIYRLCNLGNCKKE